MSDSFEDCQKFLTERGLHPCDPRQCQEWKVTLDYSKLRQSLCPDPTAVSSPMPIPLPELYNKRTGAIYFTSIDKIIEAYEALRQEDPDWTLRQCYCCCQQFDYFQKINISRKALKFVYIKILFLVSGDVYFLHFQELNVLELRR